MYTLAMIKRYGQEVVDDMIAKAKEVYKIPTRQLEEMIDEYTARVVVLLSTKKI
jgi:hypothetical protein